MSNLGSIDEYNWGKDIEICCERLEQYIVANETKKEQKTIILSTMVGQNAHKVLRDLCKSESF